jgi:hypothetical protein
MVYWKLVDDNGFWRWFHSDVEFAKNIFSGTEDYGVNDLYPHHVVVINDLERNGYRCLENWLYRLELDV